MLNPKTRLTILHDDNGSFSDFTDTAHDFFRDEFVLDLNSSEDYLYIGYYKPISSIYVYLETANTQSNTLTAEYYGEGGWTSLQDFHDDTKGFTRSGFIQWRRNQGQSSSSNSNWEETEVDSKEMYWIRLRPSQDFDVTTAVYAINLIFADDHSLVNEFPLITNSAFLQNNASDHIRFHVAARDQIVQHFRNRNYNKFSSRSRSHGDLKLINAWDLLEIEVIRQAAIFLALSKILFNASDAPEDTWSQKAFYYERLYNEQIQLARPGWDTDDDGISDEPEKRAISRSRLMKR